MACRLKTLLARTSEKAFQAQVLQLARLSGWKAYHTYDSRRSQPGFPDLVLARRGRVIFAELKSDTGRLTDDQEAWLAELRGGGAEVYVWRAADLEATARILA